MINCTLLYTLPFHSPFSWWFYCWDGCHLHSLEHCITTQNLFATLRIRYIELHAIESKVLEASESLILIDSVHFPSLLITSLMKSFLEFNSLINWLGIWKRERWFFDRFQVIPCWYQWNWLGVGFQWYSNKRPSSSNEIQYLNHWKQCYTHRAIITWVVSVVLFFAHNKFLNSKDALGTIG